MCTDSSRSSGCSRISFSNTKSCLCSPIDKISPSVFHISSLLISSVGGWRRWLHREPHDKGDYITYYAHASTPTSISSFGYLPRCAFFSMLFHWIWSCLSQSSLVFKTEFTINHVEHCRGRRGRCSGWGPIRQFLRWRKEAICSCWDVLKSCDWDTAP